MKIEIELPERKGFEYTGEFRKPKTGEWGYCYREDKTFRVYSNLGDYRPCHILKEIQAAKPKVESLEDRVNAEYPDYCVIMLERKRGMLVYEGMDKYKNHYTALSVRGFYKYVYLCNNDEFSLGHTPIAQFASYETVAVLFTKEK